jgi:DNA (cytosine-5)-methyltransferase 1
MNGLDLFSGIGGNTLALRQYIKTIAYCEADRHAQSVLLSRMGDGSIEPAPIWDDIKTLRGSLFDVPIDIIFGGFPCQDISVAGRGEGIVEGNRSGLFYEIVRLAKEIKPSFLFLENVPAIRTRGLDTVIRELTEIGYDLRWTMLSAADVGANHKRERWFLLAYSPSGRGERKLREISGKDEKESKSKKLENLCHESDPTGKYTAFMAYSECLLGKRINSNTRREHDESQFGSFSKTSFQKKQQEWWDGSHSLGSNVSDLQHIKLRKESQWWAIEPNVGRVVDGVSFRVDRIKRLGNAVVPLQAKTAFEILMGFYGTSS